MGVLRSQPRMTCYGVSIPQTLSDPLRPRDPTSPMQVASHVAIAGAIPCSPYQRSPYGGLHIIGLHMVVPYPPSPMCGAFHDLPPVVPTPLPTARPLSASTPLRWTISHNPETIVICLYLKSGLARRNPPYLTI